MRSARCAAELVRSGFTHVLNLRGGMQAYADASLPIERGP
jgi:rhodanese-related sulfurtransferase